MGTRKKKLYYIKAIAALVLVSIYSCEQYTEQQKQRYGYTLSGDGGPATYEPVKPIEKLDYLDPDKVDLGKRLFHDVRLSTDNTISCASCHDLEKGGTDQQPFSTGVKGRVGGINSPTVFNTALNFFQFWDGRAVSLENQVDGPTHAAAEMASNWEEIIAKLEKDQTYTNYFKYTYSDGITADNIKDAIAAFERSLLTPSRFDDYLRGNKEAISKAEREGYELFKKMGCSSCHQGRNVGGNMFQKFGVVGNYFDDLDRAITEADLGRFNVTGNEMDKFHFKVPTLRNVALTAPYFHDGSAATLEDAVQTMAKYQLGRDITNEEVELIVTFLESLTGKELEDNR